MADEAAEDAGDDATGHGFDEEGAANERIVGANEFFHVNLFATREDGHANGVKDNENGDDEEEGAEAEATVFGDVGQEVIVLIAVSLVL